jgi:hypothetical protein
LDTGGEGEDRERGSLEILFVLKFFFQVHSLPVLNPLIEQERMTNLDALYRTGLPRLLIIEPANMGTTSIGIWTSLFA